MDALSGIFTWLAENEATISAVVGITVLAGVVFAGLRSLVRRRGETSVKKAPAVSTETPSAVDSSPADLDPLTVPGFEGRPAIAVLPFDNLSRDPDQEYFSDGLTDDIITALSRFKDLFVIARNSTFRYKGQAVDVRQLYKELGARYVLEGSVQRSGDSLRVTAQLLDAKDGTHLWADTYDRELSTSKIFAIQDDITEHVVAGIAGSFGVISQTRFAEAKGKPVEVPSLGTLPPRRAKRINRSTIALIGCVALVAVGYGVYITNQAAIQSYLMLTLPKYLGNPIEQQVGFATTTDGVRIAYATTGQGPALVNVVGWATHLERGLTSPLYDPADGIRWLSRRHLYVRYDGRGFGLSDREVADFSLDARVRDLEAVVDTLDLDRFSILGVSAGGPTAIAYAARHPERVSRILFLSSMVTCPLPAAELEGHPVIGSTRQWSAMLDLFRSDWVSPVVRGMMVDFLWPEADEAIRRLTVEFLGISAKGTAVADFFGTKADASDLAASIESPVLVIYSQNDTTLPLTTARRLASLIPGAQFKIVEGSHAPWTPEVFAAISEFLAQEQPDAAGSAVE